MTTDITAESDIGHMVLIEQQNTRRHHNKAYDRGSDNFVHGQVRGNRSTWPPLFVPECDKSPPGHKCCLE